MEINVTKDIVKILTNDYPHENEYKIRKCYFTFDEFTDSFEVKRAIFTSLSTGLKKEIDIIDNECDIPVEILQNEYDTVKLGVYSFDIETIEENGKEKEVLKQRTSPSYDTFTVPTGSYEEGAETPEPITPSQYDIYSQELQEGLDEVEEALQEVENVNIDVQKVDHTATVTITDRYGEDKSVEIYDGEQGEAGQDAKINGHNTITIQQGTNIGLTQEGSTLTINNTYDDSAILQDISDLQTNKADKSEIPTKVSQLDNDSGYIDKNVDDLTNYTPTNELSAVATSGSYNDLEDKPDLSVYSLIIETGSKIDLEINSTTYVLNAKLYDKNNNLISTSSGIDLPLESMVVGATYDSVNKQIVLTLQNGQTLNVPVGDLVAGLQSEITSENMLSSDLVDDTNHTHKFVTTEEKTRWNNKSDFSGSYNDLTNKPDLSVYEEKSNKVTSIDENSTNTQYPSAKCVYDSQLKQDREIEKAKMVYNALPKVTGEGESVTLNDTAECPMEIKIKPSELYQEETPTPETPQDIHVVSGDNEITICGKNLFDGTGWRLVQSVSGFPQPSTGATIVSSDENNISFTSTQWTYAGVESGFIKVKANETYMLSAKFTTPTNRFFITQYDENKTRISTLNYINVSILQNTSFTTTNNGYIAVAFTNTTTSQTTYKIEDIQIEKGSTATEYEAYKGASYPVNLPVENLFDENQLLQAEGWTYSNGYYNGLVEKYYVAFRYGFSFNTTFEENTQYTIKLNAYTTGGNPRFKIEYTDGTNYMMNFTETTPTDYSYTTTNGKTISKIVGEYGTGGGQTLYLKDIMVQKGTKANSYTPYGTTPIEYCKIGNYEDEFFKNTTDSEYYNENLELDKWYLKKNIGKIVLDGSESWSAYASGDTANYYPYYTTINDIASLQDQNFRTLYCNNYDEVIWNNILNKTTDTPAIALRSSNKRLYIRTPQSTDTTFKSWLSTHNTLVYYALATPTYILLNDTLQEQLENIYNHTNSYQGQTNVSQENNDLPFVLKLSAIRDLSTL